MANHVFMMEETGFPFAERHGDYFNWVDAAKGVVRIDAYRITAAELRVLADWIDANALLARQLKDKSLGTTVVQNGGDNA